MATAVAGCSANPGPSEAASPTPGQTATRTPTPTDEPTETPIRTTDCEYFDIVVENESSQRFSGSLRILEGWDESTDAKDKEVFSGSFQLTTQQGKRFDVPDRDGRHRIHVDVEDGPSGTEKVKASEWEDNYFIQAKIKSDAIQFSNPHLDGC